MDIEFENKIKNCRTSAEKKVDYCHFPNCNKKTINSHILQEQGMLSEITNNGHLYQIEGVHFKEERFTFQKRSINRVFAFNGFCHHHDSSLFKEIEQKKPDFKKYEHCLLFVLRSLYNEIHTKEVNVKFYDILIEEMPEKYNNPVFKQHRDEEQNGINDLKFMEKQFWNDINNKTESFVFNYREIGKVELCISSIFTYDTSIEINNHLVKYGIPMERPAELVINLFPFNNKSCLLMCYHKDDETKVKGYVNCFFSESEKRILQKITNLILFQCETWACSEKLFQKQISGIENYFNKAINFTRTNYHERKFFDINIFAPDFKVKLDNWIKSHC